MKHFLLNNTLFFHDPASGLMKMPTKPIDRNKAEVVMRDATDIFDLFLDSNETLHGICQDNRNTLVYFRDSKDAHYETVLLESRSLSRPFLSPRLVCEKSGLHAFFVMQSKKGAMLTHQKISHGTSKPEVIDYTRFSPDAFDVMVDKKGNIVLLYLNSDGQLSQKTYEPSKKMWSRGEPLTDGPVRFPGLFKSCEELYMAFLHAEKSMLMLGALEENPRPIFAPFKPFGKPIYLSDKDRLSVYWCQDRGLFSVSVLEDGRIEPLRGHKISRAVIYPLAILEKGRREVVYCHILGDRIQPLTPRIQRTHEERKPSLTASKKKPEPQSLKLQKLRIQNEMLVEALKKERQKNAALLQKLRCLQGEGSSTSPPLPGDSALQAPVRTDEGNLSD